MIFAGILALEVLTLLPPVNYGYALLSVFRSWQNYELLISIGLIGCLGNFLKNTGIMADLFEELRKILSPRSIITLIPAIMGLFSMPGGALLTASMIEVEANKLGVNYELKTFLNIAFRHIWLWVLPVSSGIIFEARFSHLDVSTLVVTQLPLFFIFLAVSILMTLLTIKSNLSKKGGKIRVAILS